MYKVKPYVNNQALRTLDHSLMNSRTKSGIIAWGRPASCYVQPISVVLNRAMRCLARINFWPTNLLPFIKCKKNLQLKDIYNLEVSKFMYKYTNSKLPATFNNCFKCSSM